MRPNLTLTNSLMSHCRVNPDRPGDLKEMYNVTPGLAKASQPTYQEFYKMCLNVYPNLRLNNNRPNIIFFNFRHGPVTR